MFARKESYPIGSFSSVMFSIFAGFILLFFLAMPGIAAQTANMHWQVVTKMTSQEAINTQNHRQEVLTAFAGLRGTGIDAAIDGGKITLSSSTQGIESLRAALFSDPAANWVNFMGGPIELTLAPTVNNSPITLRLQARITTGYTWMLDTQNSDYVQDGKTVSIMRQQGLGVPSIQTIKLIPNSSKNGTARLIYQRPFEKSQIRTRVTIWPATNNSTIELTDPSPIQPIARVASLDSSAITLQPRALPAKYDSRTLNIVPAVRNQESCGSCWAFSAVGATEIAIARNGGPLDDLSEQFLVSCNKDGWSCNGGWWADAYHVDTLATAQTDIGAVLEKDKTYEAKDGDCHAAYEHPYKALSWKVISGFNLTPTDQIKDAIMTYGSVQTTVCADSGFMSYAGGVYSSIANECDGGINHAVILVGWDDATQSWIMRNSWGPDWGEQGYMRIKYDPNGTSSRVGFATAYIQAASNSTVLPDLILTSVTADATAVPGGSIYVYSEIKNQSNVAVGPFGLGIYLSDDQTIDGFSDVHTGYGCGIDGLAAGATDDSCSGWIDLPADVPNGAFYLGFYVDDFTEITEDDETNNGLAATDVTVIGDGDSETALENGVTLDDEFVDQDEWKYYSIDVPTGAVDLTVATTNSTDDIDLYTQFDAHPTDSDFICSPFTDSGDESCSESNPQAGTWWIGVYGYAGGNYSITATVTTGASAVFHTITPSAGNHGTISPNTPTSVTHGGVVDFVIRPNTGYTATVDGTCGGNLQGLNYITDPISDNCTVVASFAPITYTVTPSASTGGTISPNTPQTVNSWATKAFTVIPNAGYARTVTGTCLQGSWNGNVWTTGQIMGNCSVRFNFTAAPDFVVTATTLIPAVPTANGTYTANVTVKNQGIVAGDGKMLNVWNHQTAAQVCGAVGTKSVAVGSIAAGAAKVISITGISASTAGAKMFRAYVDSACGTAETNETNNQTTLLYTVNGPTASPDFVVTAIALTPATAIANGIFTANVTVKNQGAVAGDGKMLNVWNHQTAAQVCGAVGTKSVAVGSIAAGASKVISITGISASTAGAKMFRAYVDSACGTAETNEANNQTTLVYPVNQTTATADLTVTNIVVNTAAPVANGVITATVTVKNQGTAAADGKNLEVWSHQPNLQACGATGNARQAVGSVAAGASKTLTFSGLPAGTAGAKTLRAYVDSACGTAENNESNNQLTKAYTVQ